MTCWPPISVRCWPLWASSGARVDTAGEHLTGGRRLSWCACSGVWVSRAAGAGPSPGSCGGWAAVPLTALRAPFTLMMPFHPSPVRMTTSDRTWLGSVGQICSPPASQILNLIQKDKLWCSWGIARLLFSCVCNLCKFTEAGYKWPAVATRL